MKPGRCGSRRRKHAFCAAAFVTAAALLTLAANAGSILLNHSLGWRADISKEQFTTLTEETKDILNHLNKDVYIYYTGGTELDDLRVTTLLQNYAAASARLTYRLVDPSVHPGFTQLFDPAQTGIEKGCVIVSDTDSMSGAVPRRYKVLSSDDLYVTSEPYYNNVGALVSDYRFFVAERRITSAIDYILTDKNMRVVFLNAAGEKPPSQSLINDLGAQYYEVRTSDLTDVPLAPGSDTLIVISPQNDLSDEAYQAVDAFLTQGGKAVFFMDMLPSGLGSQEPTHWDDLFARFGLSAERSVVVGDDPSFTYMSRMNLMPELSADSPITAPLLQAKQSPVLSYAGAMTVTAAPGVTVSELLRTDATSYTKTSLKDVEKSRRQADDAAGPFVIGALARQGNAAIVLFGTSSLVSSDESYAIPGNRQLLLNTIGYLNGRQENALIPMRTVYSASDSAYKLNISSEIEKVFYIGLTAAAVPLAVLLIGVSLWYRRRHQ